MSQAFDQYPRFEHGSPSAQYAQISNFSVNYLEGLLVNLMYMELPEGLEKPANGYVDLQQKMIKRERTLRHAFQFQIEKLFSEFKLIKRSRLSSITSKDWRSLGLAGQNSSRVLARIEQISGRYQERFSGRLNTLSRRFKTLVHRSEDSKDEHPLAPINLCNAFYASIEALNLTSIQTCQLFELFECILGSQLDNFYIQIDLGMYYLDILPELTDPALFAEPEPASDYSGAVDDLEDQTMILRDGWEQKELELDVLLGDDSGLVDEPEPIEAAFRDANDHSVSGEDITQVAEEINRSSADQSTSPLTQARKEQPSSDQMVTQAPTVAAARAINESQADDCTSARSSAQHDHNIAERPTDKSENRKAGTTADASPAELSLQDHLMIFRERSNDVCDDHAKRFNDFLQTIEKFLDQEQIHNLGQFAHYYSNLLNNPLLSQSLARQLGRLSSVLVQLALAEHDFFRSSSHPANDFLHSVVDFEIRCKHQEHNLQILSGFIDSLRKLDQPTSHDFQLVLQTYDSMKQGEMSYMAKQKEEQEKFEKFLASSILKLVNQITEKLLVDQPVLGFFYDDWQLLLLQIARKIGIDSQEFEQSVEIARMLAWFLDDNRDLSHPRFSHQSFTAILKAIDRGLEVMNFSSEHRHRVRKMLVKEFKGKSETTRIVIVPSTQPVYSSTADQFSATIREQGSRLTDMTTGIRVMPRTLVETTQAAELELGTWVEIKIGKSRNYKRAKLQWKSRNNDKFVFVDQRGHKIKQLNENELDHDLANGTVKLLKTSTLLPARQSPLNRSFEHYFSTK